MFTRFAALALATMAFAGCATPINTGADFDPEADFTAYTTYSWLEAHEDKRPKSPQINNELLTQRVQRAVDRELAAKGWSKVDAEPSAWVTYHAALERRIDMRTTGSDFSYGRRYGGGGRSHTWVQEYDEGTLIVDVLDGKDRGLIWRGTAQAAVDVFASPEEKVELTNRAVKKLLAPFPPGEKK